jgi:hypothetical protein
MKKATILFIILALAFMSVPASAVYTEPVPDGLVNEVTNGDFQTGDSTGWVNDNFIIGNAAYSNPSFELGFPLGTMYQVVDESLYNGWLVNGDGKKWWLSFDYYATADEYFLDGAEANAYVFYFSSNPDAQPTFGEPSNAGEGWELLYSIYLPYTLNDVTFQVNGAVEGFKPRWVALAFEGQSAASHGLVYGVKFDNVEFYGQAVPAPPAILLLGSGLAGMSLLRWRRRRRKIIN